MHSAHELIQMVGKFSLALQLTGRLLVMYPEFVVCNVPRNRITNAKNSTIFYFKSVSTWQEDLLCMHEAHKDSWDMTLLVGNVYKLQCIFVSLDCHLLSDF